ncbi:uncharacterized protein N7500_004844 [Penicillium coprophilum]|uniref:uncharacterized protein n=1 Tax=Penicillium coprophilum TaxID=36646 RepID=UPI00238B8608|nr:uncharacterized protein N7500_004844 [Penicillium coprophilum]KAJ5163014.1 hypothetical protein N7500_004844 [Penicillium coprophilum]
MADRGTAHQHHVSKNKAPDPDSPAEFPSIEEGKQSSANGVLEALGYEAELVRNRSALHVAFMSFVLAAIPYGLATTFTYPLIGGGPVNIIWGWLAVSLITLCVAASLGEITSVYPTAGGVYYQAFMLSPPSYRRIASWICGWSYVVGNITITLAVNLGSTLFFISCINVFESAPGVGIFQAETYQVFLIFLAVTLFANAVSAFGNRWLPYLDTFAIFWTLAGLLTIVICVLAIAKEGRHDAAYVFTSFEPESGWPAGWSFCVGLLQAAYSTSSTGMVICMCEEVQQPSTQVPKAMVGTVIINTLAGFLFLVPLVFVLPDTKLLATLESGQPVPSIIKSAIGSPVGSFLLLLPLVVLAMLCVIGCTTAVSRSIWAFARDGGIPGSVWWRQINSDGVPFNAMMLGMVVQILLGLIYFGSNTAFNAFTGVGVITLTVSYACPIIVSLAGDTWSKFAVKKVDPDTSFKWYHTDIFTRWLPSTNQTVILAFDLDPPVKERFLRAVMRPDERWLNDPFWIYPHLAELIALIEEPSVWAIRDHVRLTETEAKPEGRPQPDYRRLHDIARHAIHVNETLDIALQNMEHILIQHESYISNPDNDSASSEDIHFRLRSWQSFIANLRSRSISNEKRLQNEIQLAFNTVAQHDASVTLEIGRATQLDSATMKTIAFVTLTFLPPTFICAIFSMSFFDFGGDSGWTMSNKFWVYWVFAIPTTILTTLVWTYWPEIRRILLSTNE